MTQQNGLNALQATLLGDNEKGSTYELSARNDTRYLIGFRNKGSISGDHYHKGISTGKSPEQILLLKGDVEVTCIHIESGEKVVARYSAPVRISIAPLYWHRLEALTDICFVELNSLEEHKADTFYDFRPDIADAE